MKSIVALLLFVASVVYRTLAEPAQYCNFAAGRDGPSDNDFCIAVRAYHNHSSNHGDLYISLHVYRTERKSQGWTAVGIGASMAQSLAFVVYGDPSSAGPISSVRRLNGHWEPRPFESTFNTTEIEAVTRTAAWTSQSLDAGINLTVSEMSFICFSCDTGLDSDLEALISLESSSQPWMWAKNTEQRLAEFSDTSTLEMHSLRSGWGAFYMDMTQIVAPAMKDAVAPVIKPGVSAAATSTTDKSLSLDELPQPASSYRIQASLHGFSMSLAFLLFLPSGIIAILSSHAKAVQRHRMLQVAAMTCVFTGFVLGLFLRPRLNTAHQKIGLVTALSVGLQAAIGMYHHITFLRGHSRPWISNVHIYLGRTILIAGYCSVLTGLLLHKTSLLTEQQPSAKEFSMHAGDYRLVMAEDD